MVKRLIPPKRTDFKPEELPSGGSCRECGRIYKPGETAPLVSYYPSPHQRGQVCKTVLCSEECWQEFDWRVWSHRAIQRGGLYRPKILDYIPPRRF